MIMTLLCVPWCGAFLACCNRDDIRVNVFCPCECVLLSVRMVLFCLSDCAVLLDSVVCVFLFSVCEWFYSICVCPCDCVLFCLILFCRWCSVLSVVFFSVRVNGSVLSM